MAGTIRKITRNFGEGKTRTQMVSNWYLAYWGNIECKFGYAATLWKVAGELGVENYEN